MEKEKYLKIATETLSGVFSEGGARATIEVMEKVKLKTVSDVDANLMNELNDVLYKRVRILKGDNLANQFLQSIKTACG
ncbi:MAG TPA: hypothetical protein VIO58_03350 [Candidatus Methanoperedens sp.]